MTNGWLDLSDLIDQVQELFDLGLHEQGLALLDQYRDTYSNEWEICFLYSRAHSEQDKPREAIKWLREGLRIEKDNADCLLGLFYAYTQMNRMPRGIRYLLRARRLYPDNDLVLNALIWYYTDTGRFDRAIATFERNQNLLAYNTEALRNAGIAHERAGDYNKALRCFKTALELDPADDETRDILADHFMTRNEGDKAVELYRDLLSRSANNVRALSRIVFCLSRGGNHDEAERYARQTIATYPNSPVGYVDLAYIFLNQHRYDECLAAAEQALDVSPLDAEAWRVKGIVFSERDERDNADAAFRKALSISPNDPELMRDYYNFLHDIGDFERMEKVILKVIRREHPYCVEDYWFLAEFYRDRKQPLRSFHYLTLAYRSMPAEKDLIPPMAQILFDKGHRQLAMPMLRTYVETMGWDNAMTDLTRHPTLRGKFQQEGMRFLRYVGEEAPEFRRYVFTVYLKKTIILATIVLCALCSLAAGVSVGLPGALAVAVSGVIGIPSGIWLWRKGERLVEKMRREQAEAEDAAETNPETGKTHLPERTKG